MLDASRIFHGRQAPAADEPHLGTEDDMLRLALLFLLVAILAAVFGFTGIAAAASGIAQVVFLVFLVLFVLALVGGMARTPPSDVV